MIIQYTTMGISRFAEAGARPPYARTTGSGQPMTFVSGPVWVVVVPATPAEAPARQLPR